MLGEPPALWAALAVESFGVFRVSAGRSRVVVVGIPYWLYSVTRPISRLKSLQVVATTKEQNRKQSSQFNGSSCRFSRGVCWPHLEIVEVFLSGTVQCSSAMPVAARCRAYERQRRVG